jgi:2-polyprenyl-3-methyl-5-hydroxy-6-metoxy-1,4-benzoquinol methylase
VLEHVDDPELVLRRYVAALAPGGTLVIVVPNARALHRLFGAAAGLLPDLYQLSPADLALGHKRYFDLASITQLVLDAGLRVTSTQGVYLKCLTAQQLRSLSLPPEVIQAFMQVGVQHPAIANAIYLEATH